MVGVMFFLSRSERSTGEETDSPNQPHPEGVTEIERDKGGVQSKYFGS